MEFDLEENLKQLCAAIQEGAPTAQEFADSMSKAVEFDHGSHWSTEEILANLERMKMEIFPPNPIRFQSLFDMRSSL
jgi:hypothetical protein